MLRTLAAILIAVLAAIPMPGQVEQSTDVLSAPRKLRVLVTISGPLTGVSRPTLNAAVDGSPADVQDVSPANDEPLNFAILLDVSGSMKDKQSFEKQSALELFRRLAVGRNVGFFGDFNDELYFRRKPATIDDVVKELKEIGAFRGSTTLRDSVVEAAKVVSRSAGGTSNRRAVVVFSDGEDEASKLSRKQTVASLQAEGVPVFCIGLLGSAQSRQQSVAELQTLSDSTGGVSILLTEPKEFLSTLLAAIEHQYWLTLASPAVPDGKLRSLSVRSPDARLRISAPSAIAVH